MVPIAREVESLPKETAGRNYVNEMVAVADGAESETTAEAGYQPGVVGLSDGSGTPIAEQAVPKPMPTWTTSKPKPVPQYPPPQ